jgi:hypothetical protein
VPSIAFTGPITLKAQSYLQVQYTLATLPDPSPTLYILTGGCVGLDTYVAEVLHARGYHVHTVLPGDLSKVDPAWQAHCSSHEFTPLLGTPAETYRLRNQRMVGLCDRLIVFAYTIGRNGETMTYNLARKAGKPTQVVML